MTARVILDAAGGQIGGAVRFKVKLRRYLAQNTRLTQSISCNQ